MATQASLFDAVLIEHQTLRWNEDLSAAQRAAIASELEKERNIPRYEWVKVSDLFVDESYQRSLSQDRVWSIVTNFTWSLFQALWVGDRRGKLYIVDGRHRFAAAQVLGKAIFPQVPCEIRRTANVEEEARVFIDLQEKRRKLSSAQRFKAKLLIKDPMALEIQSLFNRYKLVVTDTSGFQSWASGQPDVVNAVGTVEDLFRSGGRNHVDNVLFIVRNAWDAVVPTTSKYMLRGLGRVFERHPKLNRESFAKALKAKDPFGLIERGQRFGHSNQVSQSEALSMVLEEFL
jgi:hypothetical protein